MNHCKRAAAILLILAVMLCLCGCINTQTPDISYHDEDFFAMNTTMSVRVYADPDGVASAALVAIVRELDREFSVTEAGSALSALNLSGQTDNADIAALCKLGAEISARTDGALDITLLPASRLWGFPDKDYRIPYAYELEELEPVVGMDKLQLADGKVQLVTGAAVDLGSLAKGYAADLCRREMEGRKLCGILSLGGNIQTVGDKPDGSAWVVGIQDPDDANAFAAVLTFRGSKAVVTSGDYQRYFTMDGERYCHILDPETLSPVRSGLRSVTVVADSGALADGLSTALFVLGKDRGVEIWRASKDFEAIWISADGSVTVTEGLKDMIGECDFTVVKR